MLQGLKARLGLDTPESLERWDERIAFVVGMAMAAVILLTLFGALAMLVKTYTGPYDLSSNPLESIFGSRLMVTAARLAILAVGLYIVLSVLIHMRRGQWLTAAGPLKVSEAMQKMRSSVVQLSEQTQQALAEREHLKANVSTLTREVRTLETLLAKARDELRRTSGGKPGSR